MRDAADSTDSPSGLESHKVIAVMVDSTTYRDAVGRIKAWAGRAESRYVCACNVHMVVEAHDDLTFRKVSRTADLVTPVCGMAARDAIPVGLHGGEPAVLRRFTDNLGCPKQERWIARHRRRVPAAMARQVLRRDLE